MSDVFLATLLLLGGLCWAFLCFVAASMHPTPSQTNFGAAIYASLAASAAGAVWWGAIIWWWLA